MGICSSCLGGRRRDVYEEDDESRLLFDDANGVHYGSFGEQQMNGHEDPQEVQREIEALQRVVARTSDNMVDVYEIAPAMQGVTSTTATTPYAYAGQEARMARYQNLLSKLSQDDLVASPTAARIEWDGPDDDEDDGDDSFEMRGNGKKTLPLVKTEAGGEALVGDFADAAAAMR